MRLGDLDGVVDLINSYKTGSISKSELLWSLSQEKTIDAVPVVRCKDCKWCAQFPDGQDICKAKFMPTKADDYCSCGKRKDGEG